MDRAMHAFIWDSFDRCAPICLEMLTLTAHHPVASAFLADMHLTGRGVPRNLEQALQHASVAFDAGIDAGAVLLSQIYLSDDFDRRDIRRARDFVMALVRRGNVEAFAMHAHLLYHGLGVPEDDAMAYRFAKLAHDAGDLTGTAILAQMFVDENAPENDPAMAFRLARHLQDAHDRRGTYILAQIYANGFGVKKDRDRAVELARQASQAGLMEATELLRDLQEGDGSEFVSETAAAFNQFSQVFEKRLAPEHVAVLEVKRTVSDLNKALLEGPSLAKHRDALADHGFPVELESGVKVFVRPDQYKHVRDAVRELALQPRHIIVSLEYEEVVRSVIQNVSQKVGPKRQRALLATPGLYSEEPHVPVDVQRTFITLPVPSSLRSGASSSANGHAATYP